MIIALRHEAINLLVLKRVFEALPPKEVAEAIRVQRNSAASRRLWFFYEELTGRWLDVEDVPVVTAIGHLILAAVTPAPKPFRAAIGCGTIDPGDGPLHMHVYPETRIVQAGRALFTLGGEARGFVSGNIAVSEPTTLHWFVNVGRALASGRPSPLKRGMERGK